MATMTDAAIAWVQGCSLAAFPTVAVEAADTPAVIRAGSHEPVAEAAAEVAARLGGAPRSSRIGGHERISPDGAAAQALDFDDTQPNVDGQPSAVVLPAFLAVAEAETVR